MRILEQDVIHGPLFLIISISLSALRLDITHPVSAVVLGREAGRAGPHVVVGPVGDGGRYVVAVSVLRGVVECQDRIELDLDLVWDVIRRVGRVIRYVPKLHQNPIILQQSNIPEYIPSVECQKGVINIQQCSDQLQWEPEGRYRCTKSMARAPFWLSTAHRWTVLTPFWFSSDDFVLFH